MRLVCLILLSAALSFGAIAVDSVTAPTDQGATTPYSFNHTVSGSDTALLVWVHVRGSGISVSSVTYNSVAMTFVQSALMGTTTRVECWKLASPSSGTNSVTVTLSGAPSGSEAGAISLTGVDSTVVEANNTATGTSTTPSVAVTTLTDGALVVDGVTANVSSGWTVGSGQTQRYAVGFNTARSGFTSTEPKATAGSVTMDWTISSANWATIAVSVKPASGAAATVNPFLNAVKVF